MKFSCNCNATEEVNNVHTFQPSNSNNRNRWKASVVRRHWDLKQPLNKSRARLHALGCSLAKNNHVMLLYRHISQVSEERRPYASGQIASTSILPAFNLGQLTQGLFILVLLALGLSYYCILLLFPLSFRTVFLNAIRTSDLGSWCYCSILSFGRDAWRVTNFSHPVQLWSCLLFLREATMFLLQPICSTL